MKNVARELRIGTAKRHWPFSKGVVVDSLLNAGASPKDAAAIARQLEARLRDENKGKPISPAALKKLMVKLARPVAGAKVAASANKQLATFQEIRLQGEYGKRPFSRGTLIRSLENSGLSPRQAYTVASQIERDLRGGGIKLLSQAELDQRLEKALLQIDEQALQNYRFVRQNRGHLGVVGSTQEPPVPFSKGILSQSLLAAGVAPEMANHLSRLTERSLRSAEDRVIRRRDIREQLERLLNQEIGPDRKSVV